MRRPPRRPVLLALLTFAALARPAAGAEPITETVRLLWFGHTGGVSGHRTPNAAWRSLGDAVHPLGAGPRVFARHGRLVFRPGGLDVAPFGRFLAAGPFTAETLTEALPIVLGPFEVLFELDAEGQPTAPALLDRFIDPTEPPVPGLHTAVARLVRYTNTAGEWVLALDLDPNDDRPLHEDPLDYELRFAFEGERRPADGPPTRFHEVGRPLHEGARRVRAIEAMVDEAPERTLVLAAGDDVEDFSFANAGAPDGQRPQSFESFRRLGVDALAPGAAEVAFGLDRLQREAQQYEVRVLAANVPDGPFLGGRLREVGAAKVLLIGLAAPDMPPAARARGFGTRAFTPPAEAVRAAVAEARATLGRRPDLIVVFGQLSPAAKAELEGSPSEIDLLLTDFGPYGATPESAVIALDTPEQRVARARQRRPVPILPAGSARIGFAEITLVGDADGLRVASIESRAVPVPGDVPPDEATLRAVQTVRQAVYAPAQTELLPDLGPAIVADGTLGATALTAPLWRTLVARTLLTGLDAEVALLPRFRVPWSQTGAITRLQAAANLNVPDEVRVARLSAAQIRRLATTPAFEELVTAGLWRDPDDATELRIGGRKLDDREVYRVAFPDGLLGDPRLAPMLSGPTDARFVDRGDGHFRADASGAPLPVRAIALSRLENQRATGGAPALVADMHPTGTELTPRFVLDFVGIALEGSVYSVVGEQAAYDQVRETRISTRPNTALNARGDVVFAREGAAVDWVNRLHFLFAMADYDDAERQETADELIGSTELRIPACTLPTGGVPFANAALASEFTVTETTLDDGTVVSNPRKKQVEGTAGVMWTGDVLRLVRAGALVIHDFADTDDRSPQVGALVGIELRAPLTAAVWTLTTELRAFAPGGDDDPSELGALLKARTGLDMPVVEHLGVGLFVDLFAWRGQSSGHREPGASVITGLALKYDHRLKL